MTSSASTEDKSVVPWTVDEVNALIAIWSSVEIQEKLLGAVRKGKVYGQISDELAGVGYHRTVDQITNKLKKIKKDYRDYKANLARSGVGRNKFKSGINITLLDNVLGTRPANQTEGALNSAVAATASTSGQSQTATEILEAMCESDPSGYGTSYLCLCEMLFKTDDEQQTEIDDFFPLAKRKSQQDLLECMERMEEQRDRRFLEQTQQLNDAFLRRMDSTNAALVALLGRIVTAIEKE
ncbi:hypothetical protein ACEWY4_012703 [Coilia grayii]|uniref:Myb/SANT-like DNA-binding domain-containing protein n=1 Tax=Coilia grayii TaxID=363190 RepID=A0ABD1K188_9TELE